MELCGRGYGSGVRRWILTFFWMGFIFKDMRCSVHRGVFITAFGWTIFYNQYPLIHAAGYSGGNHPFFCVAFILFLFSPLSSPEQFYILFIYGIGFSFLLGLHLAEALIVIFLETLRFS